MSAESIPFAENASALLSEQLGPFTGWEWLGIGIAGGVIYYAVRNDIAKIMGKNT